MKKIILIPDSFKGTMSSETICEIMRASVKRRFPDAQVISIPVADGGEGSVDCFLAAIGGKKKHARVAGVFYKSMQGYYAMLPSEDTAVIEMACCAGLPLAEGHLDPCRATTYGVGELMLAAARDGAKHIILGLGGSASNDGGCGAAAAAGVLFYNETGDTFVPTGGTLSDIARIDVSKFHPLMKGVKVTAMCDINNPMFGKNGAAHIFAPQKGANAQTVELLDAGLRHLSHRIREDLGLDVSLLPGGGAAGAMGAGMRAFFGARLQMGIETVLDTVGFDEKLDGADMVFTGEGRLDSQSLSGKVVIGVARRSYAKKVPVIAVVGSIGQGAHGAYAEGVSAIFSINPAPVDFSISRQFSTQNLTLTMDNILRFAEVLTRKR